ncbi:MAG: type I-C CRISPR-associated endonuclease Cas1c [Armatimonadota bacterium]
MPQVLLNTLYVQADGAYVHLDYDTVMVDVDDRTALRIPLIHIDGIVLFGDATISSKAIERMATEGKHVTYMDFAGRYKARVVGPTHGNVLLRVAQYMALDKEGRQLHIARSIVAAKIRNSRYVVQRAARDAKTDEARDVLKACTMAMALSVGNLANCGNLDQIRGVEGDAASVYFEALPFLITAKSAEFSFNVRSRRPPRDRVNAMLSFGYALLHHDCMSAAESVGLDPQVGFLHALRPGRPALALDIMEEFRAIIVDRMVLNMINRKQIRPEHFDVRELAGEAVLLNAEGRKLFLTEYQEYKKRTVDHGFATGLITMGHLPFIQAKLLARYLRGDVEVYHPYLMKD